MTINEKLAKKLEQGREYRNTQVFDVKADDENNGGEMVVRGYASTFNDPYMLFDMGDYRVFEQIDARAFDECDMDDVIMQYDHAGRVFARTANGTLKISTDEHGLYCEADLSGTEAGRALYEEIKGGYTNKMSFGFIVDEDTRSESTNGNTVEILRTVTRVKKLFDVSAVSIPANNGTDISARTYGEGVIGEAKAERQRAHEMAMQKQKIKIMGGLK